MAAAEEELILESLVTIVRDYLCISWLTWGKNRARMPSCIDDLCDNVFNYLQTVNVTVPEILKDGKQLEIPSKHAMNITKLDSIHEARHMKDAELNWEAECSWFMPEVCDEVIGGYSATPRQKEEDIKITLSDRKLLARQQAKRIIVRTLARRVSVMTNDVEENHTQHKTHELPRDDTQKELREIKNNQVILQTNVTTLIDKENEELNKTCHYKENHNIYQDELVCSKQRITCQHEALVTAKMKETATTNRSCVFI